jgi:hypothetical protein
MAKKVWTVDLEDGHHTVELEHAYLSGKRVITLDGREVVRAQSVLDFGSEHPFQIGTHPALARISTNGLTFSYDLAVDGRSVATGKEVTQQPPMPKWAWIFIVLCAAIPVVAIGGAVPLLIGLAGGAACSRIAKHVSWSVAGRMAACAAVTLVSWVAFIAFIVGIGVLRGSG